MLRASPDRVKKPALAPPAAGDLTPGRASPIVSGGGLFSGCGATPEVLLNGLRVIGGDRRGFRLSVPAGPHLRPTSNRVREALFDILGERVLGCRFLDLFAGTGAVGIEALSRGAREAVFVEQEPSRIRCLRRNLEACGFTGRARVVTGSLPGVLRRLRGGGVYDLVFVDPPYDRPIGPPLAEVLAGRKLLGPGTLLVLEHRKSEAPATDLPPLVRERFYRYGDTLLTLFRMTGEGGPVGETV